MIDNEKKSHREKRPLKRLVLLFDSWGIYKIACFLYICFFVFVAIWDIGKSTNDIPFPWYIPLVVFIVFVIPVYLSYLAGKKNKNKFYKVKSPWKDHFGNDIYEGDVIKHQTGEKGVVFCFGEPDNPATVTDNWLVYYGDHGPPSRLCLQIGNKGLAVVDLSKRKFK